MSGHSHAKTIKHKKDLADAQRGRVFSKMARLITIAARDGGNPEVNSKLREAIDKAKQANLPADNIERAIKRGIGGIEGKELEEVLIEAYGPANIALIIEGITDNKNRALAEIKQILGQHNGKLVGEGSVRWMFERKGIIVINPKSQISNSKNKEELELKMIDAGAENIVWRDDVLEIYTSIEKLEEIKQKLQNLGIEIESSTLGWMAKNEIKIPEKQQQVAEKLFEALDENEAVQEIYSNLKL